MSNFSKILVAEDEEQIRTAMKMILRSEGYSVDLASNGKEALQMIQESIDSGEPYDLLITDVQMPEMTGIELITALKQINTSIETLVMTGFGDKKMVVTLMRLGCSGYIDKPFQADDLVASIQDVFEKSNKTKKKNSESTERFNQKYRSLMNHVSEAKRSYNDLITTDLSKIPARVFVKNHPKDDLGGDFYSLIPVKDGFVMLVADISGHDMGAAYYSVLLKAFFEEYCSHFEGEVSSFFTIVNKALSSTGMSRMITAQIVFWNLTEGCLTFQNAGHPSAFRVSADGKSVDTLCNEQPVLGVLEHAHFESTTYPIEVGQRFFFLTDGLPDLQRIDGESGTKTILGQSGVERLIITHAELPLSDMTDRIWDDAVKFARFKFCDDTLLIGIELGGENV